jgi:hypothetical protein
MKHAPIHSRFLASAVGLALAASASAQDQSTSLTIYSTVTPGAIPASVYRPVPPSMGGNFYNAYNPWQGRPLPGYAVIRQDRPVTLKAGRGIVQFTDVAALIDPTTVSFTSLTDPAGTRVLDQNYQFDLVSAQKMIERFVGQQINIDGQDVTLLASTGGSYLVREADGKIRYQQSAPSAVRFNKLPEGLMTKPTLTWDVVAAKDGPHQTRVSYQTEGITWWADYNLIWSEGKSANDGTLDVGAWVSILNQSGATYENAKLKLVAGDVHRAPQPGQGGMREMRLEMAAKSGNEADLGFAEKSFFEYHLYTLGRPTSIPENSTKQIELFDAARGVPTEKVLVYYGLDEQFRHGFWGSPMNDRNFGISSNKKVDTYLRFKNDKTNGLGIPLPSGRIRVSKLDAADGSMEFIGEDVIDHTPQGEEVLVKMGSAFDVVGERVQTDFVWNDGKQELLETYEIKIRNRKKDAVNVIIKENLFRWTNWEIVKQSTDFQKIDARTIHFPIRVEPDKEMVVRYTARYWW